MVRISISKSLNKWWNHLTLHTMYISMCLNVCSRVNRRDKFAKDCTLTSSKDTKKEIHTCWLLEVASEAQNLHLSKYLPCQCTAHHCQMEAYTCKFLVFSQVLKMQCIMHYPFACIWGSRSMKSASIWL